MKYLASGLDGTLIHNGEIKKRRYRCYIKTKI